VVIVRSAQVEAPPVLPAVPDWSPYATEGVFVSPVGPVVACEDHRHAARLPFARLGDPCAGACFAF
jgi:hypothetical protein